MQSVVITGASGFIGTRLVADLIDNGNYRVKILSRSKAKASSILGEYASKVEIFEGDLADSTSLNGLLVEGCIVINLVYLWKGGKHLNIECVQNLLKACKAAKIARLVHCSTAAVVGRSPKTLINELTPCVPISEYGLTKLKIEQDIIEYSQGQFDAVILRPTSVFGKNGEPLKKLSTDLSSGKRWGNYTKSCLFGNRSMNLIPVANVVSAIVFLSKYAGPFNGDIFIASEDGDRVNNFVEIEKLLMRELRIKEYPLPRIQVPLIVLKLLLTLLGRNNTNPTCKFESSKLGKLGFISPVTLSEGLTEYANWFRSTHSDLSS